MCTGYVFTDSAEAIRDLFRITAPLPNWHLTSGQSMSADHSDL
jgi:hypothetical protein